MRLFILDDHPQVIRMLENVISESGLGEVVGQHTSPIEALSMILNLQPDILIVDFLMPDMDGAQLVSQVKAALPHCHCVMLSQVSAKGMIEKAYQAGISFFISKPINQIEVTRVLRQVSDQILMSKKFQALHMLLADDRNQGAFAMAGTPSSRPLSRQNNVQLDIYKRALGKIGILGEAGAEDILRICQYYIESGKTTSQVKVNDVCHLVCDQPKAMEQRLRRAINRGLVNLANLGIEDYMNDLFLQFSSTLYDFESVKAQMDYIRGKKTAGGKISVRKFIDNLLMIVE